MGWIYGNRTTLTEVPLGDGGISLNAQEQVCKKQANLTGGEKDLWERESCKAQDTEKIISAVVHGREHLHNSSRNTRLEYR